MNVLGRYFISVLLLLPSVVWAWNAAGHKLVAEIAYEHLTPAVRQQVDELTHALDHDFPRVNFISAAVWPDWLKGEDITAFNAWHYINIPYVVDAAQPRIIPAQNVVWAIHQAEHVLASNKAHTFEKGLFLRFLAHMVGDIHQPLHCINLYSPRHPHGDHGGNSYRIISPMADNLHTAWDGGLGVFADDMLLLAHSIEQRYPPEHFAQVLTDEEPQHWADDSFKLARQYAYTVPENAQLSAAYIANGQAVIEAQVALAGYRLAHVLNNILGDATDAQGTNHRRG